MDFLLSLPEFWRNAIGIGALFVLVLLPLAVAMGSVRDARNKYYDHS